ncbi:hypothetical protein WDW86_10310 [Bdellovibrionota bacterium FG-2]
MMTATSTGAVRRTTVVANSVVMQLGFGFSSIGSSQVTSEGDVAIRLGKAAVHYREGIDRLMLVQRLAAEEILRQRQQKLFNYMTNLAGREKISIANLDRYWMAWQEFARASGAGTPIPDACSGGEGEIHFNLDTENHHLELQFSDDGKAEIFYRDRESGLIWSDEYDIGNLEKDHMLSQKINKVLTPFRFF